MLCELCYDQDLYLLQIALVVLPPDLVIVSILDCFRLLAHFSGNLWQASFASMFADGVDNDSDHDTAAGNGNESMYDTSGDKGEMVWDMYCFPGGFEWGGMLFGALLGSFML